MSGGESADRAVEVHACNMGGIEETTVAFGPGPTVLSGRNATNRTSFLQAIMAALGSDDVSLKGDSDEGQVTLTIDGTTYDRQLLREDGIVTTVGDPYLDDPQSAELFAFLLERNKVRRTVENEGDLRELVMQPVDSDAIEAQVEQLLSERDKIDEELHELAEVADRRPDLVSEQNRLDNEIKDRRTALGETEAAINAVEKEIDDSDEKAHALEERLDELSSLRSELEEVRFQIESQRESMTALHDQCEELSTEFADVEPAADEDLEALEAERAGLQERKQSLEVIINDLQSVVQFNEGKLSRDDDEFFGVVNGDDGAPPEQLLDATNVVCWTCGSQVDRTRIESTLDTLRDLRREKVEERNQVESDLAEIRDERSELTEREQRLDQLRRELQEARTDMAVREERISDLSKRKAALMDEIDALEETIEDLREREFDDVLSLHEKANHLEFELGRLEDERASVVAKINAIDDRLAERAEIEEHRTAIEEDLVDLRTKVEQIESELVEKFNQHIATVLSLLEYENLERVWIERRHRESCPGRKSEDMTKFDLHVVRSSASGASYEDTLGHLSESEREVTGIVFALAGYLVHDVHDSLPFILLDSLEAIDSERIAALIEYLSDYSEYLIVALLPEDARALPDTYQRITEI